MILRLLERTLFVSQIHLAVIRTDLGESINQELSKKKDKTVTIKVLII